MATMRLRRRATLLSAAVVLALLAVLAATPSPARTAGAAFAARTSGTSVCDRVRDARPGGTGMVVVGASYTYGLGATSRRLGYAPDLARLLHRPARIYGVPGTGFLDPGRHDQGTFATRLARIPRRPAPGLVLVQGGRDDARFPPHRELLAAERTICLAHQRFATARIALLGPVAASLPAGARLVAVDAALRTACRREGALYLDPLAQHWMDLAQVHRFAGPVRGHPNDAGYRYIADRVARDLTRDGAVPRPSSA